MQTGTYTLQKNTEHHLKFWKIHKSIYIIIMLICWVFFYMNNHDVRFNPKKKKNHHHVSKF